jgi:hypothetical protein
MRGPGCNAITTAAEPCDFFRLPNNKEVSYRERDLLGRGVTHEKAWEVMNMARRIAAIVLTKPPLSRITRP